MNERDSVGADGGPVLGLFVLTLLFTVAVCAAFILGAMDGRFGAGGADNGGRYGYSGSVDVGVMGEELPWLVGVGGDPAVGRVAPSLFGVSLEGEKVLVDSGGGKPKLLVFVEDGCDGCRQQLARFGSWVNTSESVEGVQVLVVLPSGGGGRAGSVAGWLLAQQWRVPTLLDDAGGAVRRVYGVRGSPQFVAVNAYGLVAARAGGALTVEDFERLVVASRSDVVPSEDVLRGGDDHLHHHHD